VAPGRCSGTFGNVNMRVEGLNQTWNVDSEEALETALSTRDARGGAEFWLSPAKSRHPCLAVQVGGTFSSVTFFPKEDHPGFRCLGGKGLPAAGITKLIFEGCDPGDGEQIPNRFVIPFSSALAVAKVFFTGSIMSDTEDWLEL
jgi:hypothetical protein